MQPANATGSVAHPPHSQPSSNGGACKSVPAPAPTVAAMSPGRDEEGETQPGLGGSPSAASPALVPGESGPGLRDPGPRRQSPRGQITGDPVHARSGSAPAADAASQEDQQRGVNGGAARRAGPEREGAVEADGEGSAALGGKAAGEGSAGKQADSDARGPVAEGGAAAGAEVVASASEPQADSWLELHGVPALPQFRNLPSTPDLGIDLDVVLSRESALCSWSPGCCHTPPHGSVLMCLHAQGREAWPALGAVELSLCARQLQPGMRCASAPESICMH